MNDIAEKTLEWLYKQLKENRISLARAEVKGAGGTEIVNLREKIEMLEWLIDRVLKEI